MESTKTGEFILIKDCRDSTTALVFSGLIVALALCFCLYTLQGYAWWRVTRQKQGRVIRYLLLAAVLLMIATPCFGFVGQMMPLAILFALTLVAQYFMHATTTVLVRHLLSSKASAEQRKTRWVILPLHYAYGLLLIAGVIEIVTTSSNDDSFEQAEETKEAPDTNNTDQDAPDVESSPDEEAQSAIPYSFYALALLLVLSMLLVLCMRQKGFLIARREPIGVAISATRSSAQQPERLSKRKSSSKEESKRVDDVEKGPDQRTDQGAQPTSEVLIKYRASRHICLSVWCFFANLMGFVAMVLLMKVQQRVRLNSDGQWTFESCDVALLIDTMLRFMILNSAILPRLVFLKTEQQTQPKAWWGQSLSQVCGDYKRALLTCSPETYSDTEATILDELKQRSSKDNSGQAELPGAMITLVKNDNSRNNSRNPNKNISLLHDSQKVDQMRLPTNDSQPGEEGEDTDQYNLPSARCDTEEGLLDQKPRLQPAGPSSQELLQNAQSSGDSHGRQNFKPQQFQQPKAGNMNSQNSKAKKPPEQQTPAEIKRQGLKKQNQKPSTPLDTIVEEEKCPSSSAGTLLLCSHQKSSYDTNMREGSPVTDKGLAIEHRSGGSGPITLHYFNEVAGLANGERKMELSEQGFEPRQSSKQSGSEQNTTKKQKKPRGPLEEEKAAQKDSSPSDSRLDDVSLGSIHLRLTDNNRPIEKTPQVQSGQHVLHQRSEGAAQRDPAAMLRAQNQSQRKTSIASNASEDHIYKPGFQDDDYRLPVTLKKPAKDVKRNQHGKTAPNSKQQTSSSAHPQDEMKGEPTEQKSKLVPGPAGGCPESPRMPKSPQSQRLKVPNRSAPTQREDHGNQKRRLKQQAPTDQLISFGGPGVGHNQQQLEGSLTEAFMSLNTPQATDTENDGQFSLDDGHQSEIPPFKDNPSSYIQRQPTDPDRQDSKHEANEILAGQNYRSSNTISPVTWQGDSKTSKQSNEKSGTNLQDKPRQQALASGEVEIKLERGLSFGEILTEGQLQQAVSLHRASEGGPESQTPQSPWVENSYGSASSGYERKLEGDEDRQGSSNHSQSHRYSQADLSNQGGASQHSGDFTPPRQDDDEVFEQAKHHQILNDIDQTSARNAASDLRPNKSQRSVGKRGTHGVHKSNHSMMADGVNRRPSHISFGHQKSVNKTFVTTQSKMRVLGVVKCNLKRGGPYREPDLQTIQAEQKMQTKKDQQIHRKVKKVEVTEETVTVKVNNGQRQLEESEYFVYEDDIEDKRYVLQDERSHLMHQRLNKTEIKSRQPHTRSELSSGRANIRKPANNQRIQAERSASDEEGFPEVEDCQLPVARGMRRGGNYDFCESHIEPRRDANQTVIDEFNLVRELEHSDNRLNRTSFMNGNHNQRRNHQQSELVHNRPIQHNQPIQHIQNYVNEDLRLKQLQQQETAKQSKWPSKRLAESSQAHNVLSDRIVPRLQKRRDLAIQEQNKEIQNQRRHQELPQHEETQKAVEDNAAPKSRSWSQIARENRQKFELNKHLQVGSQTPRPGNGAHQPALTRGQAFANPNPNRLLLGYQKSILKKNASESQQAGPAGQQTRRRSKNVSFSEYQHVGTGTRGQGRLQDFYGADSDFYVHGGGPSNRAYDQDRHQSGSEVSEGKNPRGPSQFGDFYSQRNQNDESVGPSPGTSPLKEAGYDTGHRRGTRRR